MSINNNQKSYLLLLDQYQCPHVCILWHVEAEEAVLEDEKKYSEVLETYWNNIAKKKI